MTMWTDFRDLWKSAVNPQSTQYDFMQEPLLSDEVWIAWDHTARLIDAATQQPDNIMLVPAPSRAQGPRLHAGHHRPGYPQGRA